MTTTEKTKITIKATVDAPVDKVWKYWSEPQHITKWNSPSDDWHSPRATNDLKEDGKFNFRMEAKDGSMGFDFEGVYDKVIPHQEIEYTLGDGRKVDVIFKSEGGKTTITETFEAENMNSIEMQRGGWQAILDNFKTYAESN